ncbi:MAG: DUF3536 domain-containing protein [bacterium]|nr:DUF3536 domain-containing protein [bacterium]
MSRYVCIHGHFYQPPRENAWLGAVEVQDSAHPYHDWNQRITAECYAPNASSRILDRNERIVELVNNYSRISFNFGPTLLVWLERHEPETYRAILDGDRESRRRFSGHGSALAQVYSHPILPLCNERDRRTQVAWGLRDFEQRFGRPAEGMWLPETAVDLASLETLAEHGVRFSILAPSQAALIRRRGEREYGEIGEDGFDTTRPYRLNLASGRTIDLFFYHGGISRAVAFEQLLGRGEELARRLVEPLQQPADHARLVHIATDGESYGHHHRFGDMALAYALHAIEEQGLAKITNYGEYLERHPPEDEVRIHERTSWSCAHGVERWRGDCGCASEYRQGWHQAWRAPLRDALDRLRDAVTPRFEQAAADYFDDPWGARDAYVERLLDATDDAAHDFLARHATGANDDADRTRALELMELQRNLLLMYTSCGWFFEDVSRIEGIQILQYAARAAELAERCFERPFEAPFLELLESAPSNVMEFGNARRLYESKVLPARVDAAKLGAAHAASLLFDDETAAPPQVHFSVEQEEQVRDAAGEAKLAVGRLRVVSRLTHESEDLTFGFAHLGDHNLSGGIRPFRGESDYREAGDELQRCFGAADYPETVRLLDRLFPGTRFSLKTLLVDTRRRILSTILGSTLRDAQDVHRRLYRQHASLMRFLGGLDVPSPEALRATAELVLNGGIREALESAELDTLRVRRLLDEMLGASIPLHEDDLGFAARDAVLRAMRRLERSPEDCAALDRLETAVRLVRDLPFDVVLAQTENSFFRLVSERIDPLRERATQGDAQAEAWLRRVRELGAALHVAVD